jgi:hypothetical protein
VKSTSSDSKTYSSLGGSTPSTAGIQAIKFVEEPVNLNLTEELKKHVGREIFLFSCNIVKYNQFGWRNNRTFVLT